MKTVPNYTRIARAILIAAEHGADFAELGQRLQLMLAGKLTPDDAAAEPTDEEQRVRARLVAKLAEPGGVLALRNLVASLFARASLSRAEEVELRIAMQLIPVRPPDPAA